MSQDLLVELWVARTHKSQALACSDVTVMFAASVVFLSKCDPLPLFDSHRNLNGFATSIYCKKNVSLTAERDQWFLQSRRKPLHIYCILNPTRSCVRTNTLIVVAVAASQALLQRSLFTYWALCYVGCVGVLVLGRTCVQWLPPSFTMLSRRCLCTHWMSVVNSIKLDKGWDGASKALSEEEQDLFSWILKTLVII